MVLLSRYDWPRASGLFPNVSGELARERLASLIVHRERRNKGLNGTAVAGTVDTADHIIDLGPEGGGGGGRIVAQGTPEAIASVPESHTGQYLAGHLPGLRAALTRKSA